MITRIDHLGIAVKSLAEAVPLYEKALGLKCERIEEVASQKVRTAFFDVGGTHLELLEPTADDSPVAKFLADRGEGVYHVAFASDDLVGQLAQAKGAGVRLINEVQPCLDTDPATLMGLMMKAGQIAVMEMQAHRDARSSFDWSSQGMSVKKVLLPRNEIQLLAQENASLEAEIGRFRMSGIGVRPQQDIYRPQPEIIVSTVFEVDA